MSKDILASEAGVALHSILVMRTSWETAKWNGDMIFVVAQLGDRAAFEDLLAPTEDLQGAIIDNRQSTIDNRQSTIDNRQSTVNFGTVGQSTELQCCFKAMTQN
ncbi:hypothetical protein TWF706_009227 [Orbilia oligospora]|nr:hypothetical protein TWF706_009227 [Orbilia oligospora]